MDARKSAIFAFQFVKPILQTITHLIRSWNATHGFRDSVLVCKIHDCMTRKNFEHFHSLPSSDVSITVGSLDEKKPLQNSFKRI